MNTFAAFQTLGIPVTKDVNVIQHAFAVKSHAAHPEESPQQWSELTEAYQLAMEYAKSDSISIAVAVHKECAQTKSTAQEAQEESETPGEYDTLFEALGEEDAEGQYAPGELALRESLLSLAEKQREINRQDRWRHLMLRMHKKHLKQAAEIGMVVLQDSTIELLLKSFHYRPGRIILNENERVYQREVRKLLKNYRSQLEAAGWGQAADGVFGDYEPGMTKGAFKCLLIILIIMNLFTIPMIFKRQSVQTEVGRIHYVDWQPETAAETYVTLTVAEASPPGTSYTMEGKREKLGNSYITVTYYTYYTYVKAKTEDGSPVNLVYISQRTDNGLFNTDSNWVLDFTFDAEQLQKKVETAPVQLKGLTRTMTYSGAGLYRYTANETDWVLNPTEIVQRAHEMNLLYPEGTSAVVLKENGVGMPEEGESIYETSKQWKFEPIMLPVAMVFWIPLLLMLPVRLGVFKTFRVRDT